MECPPDPMPAIECPPCPAAALLAAAGAGAAADEAGGVEVPPQAAVRPRAATQAAPPSRRAERNVGRCTIGEGSHLAPGTVAVLRAGGDRRRRSSGRRSPATP